MNIWTKTLTVAERFDRIPTSNEWNSERKTKTFPVYLRDRAAELYESL